MPESRWKVAETALILIADDEPLIRFTAEALLKTRGYRVITAADGVECLRQYQSAGPENVALVILDFEMPSMNGGEAFRHIRAINPEAKILVSSGSVTGEQVEILTKEGLTGVVPKPYAAKELLNAVAATLG